MRRQEESVAGNIVVAVLGLALLPITIIFNGMTLSVLWRDFVVPLGVRSITPAHAIGLCAIVGFLTHVPVSTDKKREDTTASRDVAVAYGIVAMRIIVALSIGWFARQLGGVL